MEQTLVLDSSISEAKSKRNDMLKIFAMVTMLIDHIGHMFFPELLILRTIGRLAFPIFAYQLAIGYSKTSDLKKYTLRLLMFGVIAHIPYSFFIYRLEFTPFHFNIMFTLAAAIGLLVVYDKAIKLIKDFKETRNIKDLIYGILMFIACILIIFAPELISLKFRNFALEYGFFGLSIVLLFHILREKKIALTIGLAALLFAYAFSRGLLRMAGWTPEWVLHWLLHPTYVWDTITNEGMMTTLTGYFFQARALFALIPIFIFESFESKIRLNRYIGYVFYPLHIGIMVVIALILKKM